MILNNTGKVFIGSISKVRCIINNSFIIVTKKGTVIVIDPFKVDYNIKPDVIAVTHSDFDHYDEKYINQNECCKIIFSIGRFTYKDVTITGIAASHCGDNILENNPNNVIYIFEVDGFRIAHFGDTGQNFLTEEQLKQIGEIDLAMMQFTNPNSDFTLSNRKGIKILKQVNPDIIIPTHAFGIKQFNIGNKAYFLPVHNIGKTLKLLKQDGALLLKRRYILLNKELEHQQQYKVVWLKRTMSWDKINITLR